MDYIVSAINSAYDKTKSILFPFDFKKWLIIAFCAWLYGFGYIDINFKLGINLPSDFFRGFMEGFKSGMNQNYNHYTQNTAPYKAYTNCENGICTIPQHKKPTVFLTNSFEKFIENIAPAAIIGIFVFFILLFIGLLIFFNYIGSIGAFMYLDTLSNEIPVLKGLWTKYKSRGTDLFKYKLVLMFKSFLAVMALIISIIVVILLSLALRSKIFVILFFIFGLLLLFFLLIFINFVFLVLSDFIIPYMFFYNVNVQEAKYKIWELIKKNKGNFIIYYIMKTLLIIAISIVLAFISCLTCCILSCIIIIPFVGTFLFLPVLVFLRLFSIYYLENFGMELLSTKEIL